MDSIRGSDLQMRIVSWNCNGKFREKHEIIQELDADIYVIQECENPKLTKNKKYQEFASNHLWHGISKHRGLGIFAAKDILLEDNKWESHYLREFISAKINEDFNLLAVWARKPYIEEYCVYQSIDFEKFNDEMIVIGDFNSNKIWDNKHGERDHSAVVNKLEEKNLHSAYHCVKGENQGEENEDTFYMYRHPDKGYHIDYAFLRSDRIKRFQVLSKGNWLNYSDHIPLVLEIRNVSTID